MVIVRLAKLVEGVDRRGSNLARKNANRGEQSRRTLPKNLIVRLPMQDLNERGFRDLLSWSRAHNHRDWED
jgi:hypothetical protein